jgi:hypothetical protein
MELINVNRRSFLRALATAPLAPLLIQKGKTFTLQSAGSVTMTLPPPVPGLKTMIRVHDSLLFDGPWTATEIDAIIERELAFMARGLRTTRIRELTEDEKRVAKNETTAARINSLTMATSVVP